jgi:hypothetical protein
MAALKLGQQAAEWAQSQWIYVQDGRETTFDQDCQDGRTA